LEKSKAKLGADHPQTLTALNNLALGYRSAGKHDLAVPLYEETLARRKATLGADHPDTLWSMHNLAGAYLDAGNCAAAEPLLVGWLDKQRSKQPADELLVAWNLNRLGGCRVALKKFAEAEAPLRDSLAIYMQKQPKAVMRHDTASLLGAALAGQEKYAEAETLLVGSAKVFLGSAAKLSPANKKLAQAAVQRVSDFYAAQGNAQEAARWRKLGEEAFGPPKNKNSDQPPVLFWHVPGERLGVLLVVHLAKLGRQLFAEEHVVRVV
jgi:hypothetical protein